LRFAGSRLKEIRDSKGGASIAVIGSDTSTNEEIYLLQKFARTVLQTNSIDHVRSADYTTFARAIAGHPQRSAGLRDIANAPAILLVGGNPTEENPLLAWELRTNVRLNRARLYVANANPIKLERQAKATLQILAGNYAPLSAYLSGNESTIPHAAFREALLAESSLVVLLASEIAGADLESLVQWGLGRDNVRFALLGAHANSRGAADMGLLPDLLPGYVPVQAPASYSADYVGLPGAPGNRLSDIIPAAAADSLGALLVFGADPLAGKGISTEGLNSTFVVVSDLFLTETATVADVVFPSASLYEKTGTVTNTYGDLQLAKKAADHAGIKPDFEILVRLADAMGANVKALVPFSSRGVTADLGQSRGAQAGEADRHAVWLAANNLEPKLSPFDPLALLDEIERLVPGYKLDRLNLFGGNDVPTDPGFVTISELIASSSVVPNQDSLFTSGNLSRYSPALKELADHQNAETAIAAAD